MILAPAQHLHGFVLGEGGAAMFARLFREDRGDGARAVERAEEAELLEAHAVKAAAVRVFDHAHASSALLVDAEAQARAQLRPQHFRFADGAIFGRRFHVAEITTTTP